MDEAASRGRLDGDQRIEKKHIYQVISLWTHIPLGDIEEKESISLLNLEDRIRKEIVGQDLAVKTVSQALMRSRVGLRNGT